MKTQAELKAELKASAEKAVTFVLTMASFIQKKGLHKAANSAIRFDTNEAKGAVVKITNALKWQLGFCIPDDIRIELRTQSDKTAGQSWTELIELKTIKDHLPAALETYADELQKAFAIKRPAKSVTTFKLQEGECIFLAYRRLLSHQENDLIRVIMNNISNSHRINGFYVANAMAQIAIFIGCMDTLTIKTPFERYEKSISNLMQKDGYFTNGWPEDLLFHDPETLRCAKGSETFQGIYAHPERAASAAVHLGGLPATSDKTLRIA